MTELKQMRVYFQFRHSFLSHSVSLYSPSLPFSLLHTHCTLENCDEHIVLIDSPWTNQDKVWKEYM